MKLIINGEVKKFSDGITLDKVLEKLGLTGKVMAAAVNMDIVKQDKWSVHKLCDGDKLELLDFVGGG
jgi:sulfur carrier protein